MINKNDTNKDIMQNAVMYEVEQISHLLDVTDIMVRTTKPSKKALLERVEYLTIALQRLIKQITEIK